MGSNNPFDYAVLAMFLVMIGLGSLFLAFGLVSLHRANILTDRAREQWDRTLKKERVLAADVYAPPVALDDLIRARRTLSSYSLIATGASAVAVQLLALLCVRIFWGRIVGVDDTAAIALTDAFYLSLAAGCAAYYALVPQQSPAPRGVPQFMWAWLLLPNAALWVVIVALTIAFQTRHLATTGQQIDTQIALHSRPWLLWIYPMTMLLGMVAYAALHHRASQVAPDFTPDEQLNERAQRRWQSQAVSLAAFAAFTVAGFVGFQLSLFDLSNRVLYWLLEVWVVSHMVGDLYLARRLSLQLRPG